MRRAAWLTARFLTFKERIERSVLSPHKELGVGEGGHTVELGFACDQWEDERELTCEHVLFGDGT